MGRKLVPTSTIMRRMDRKDLRFQAEARAKARLTAEIEAFRQRTRTPTERRTDAWYAADCPPLEAVHVVPVKS
jgi:hypothetical protein